MDKKQIQTRIEQIFIARGWAIMSREIEMIDEIVEYIQETVDEAESSAWDRGVDNERMNRFYDY